MILDFFYQLDPYKIVDEKKVYDLLSIIQKVEKVQFGEIDFQLVDDQKILEINNTFLQHDYFTDIITFDYSLVNIINGEIFISFDTVLSNAHKYAATPVTEMYRVIIHGVMHLIGFSDTSEEEKTSMQQKENEYLAYLEKL